MGASTSVESPSEKPKVVLVPPMIERDVRCRNRFAKPSYDYMFCKKQIEHLLGDFDKLGVRGLLLFSPPEDEHISIKASLGLNRSSMALRWQLDPNLIYTFVDVKAAPRQSNTGGLAVRASYFDTNTGLGFFAAAPFLATLKHRQMAQIGVRYSSPMMTCGLMSQPQRACLSTAWMCGRVGSWSAGVKLSTDQTPVVELPGMAKIVSVSDVAEWVHQHASVIVAYSPVSNADKPNATSGRFTASVEVQESRKLVVSFFQHFALVRRVFNPLEKDNVVGITNYVDIAIQISTPMSSSSMDVGSESSASQPPATTSSPALAAAPAASSPAAPAAAPSTPSAWSSRSERSDSGVNIGVSWQVNKNWMVKARVGDASAAVAMALRSWMNPSFLLLGTMSYCYNNRLPTFGLKIQLENFGGLRYERGTQELRGRALLQRHVASGADLANFDGDTGNVVELDANEGDYSPRKVSTPDGMSSFL